MVTTYSLAADGDKKITPHFRVREFACRDGSDKILFDPDAAAALEVIRAYYREHVHPGCTISPNSGYRTATYNRRIGGAKASYHVKGMAVDFTVRIPNGGVVDPQRVYRECNDGAIFGKSWRGGLGRYANFTHLDVGPKRRWKG